MRIVQLANFIGPTAGGLKRAVGELGQGYVAAGHERLLIKPGPRDALVADDDGYTLSLASPQIHGQRLIVAADRVRAALVKFAPTSIEVSDKLTLTLAASWARRHRVGSILLSHQRLDEMVSLHFQRDLVRPVHQLNAWLAGQFDRVVVTTAFSAGEWANTAANLVRIPLGVDLERFTPAAVVRPPGPNLNLVYVGRLAREKSPHLAVAAAVELDRRGHTVRLDIHGTGPHLDELRMVAAGTSVYFHGYSEDRDVVAAAYRRADIALSVCPAETFGLAALEALACGTPVITADQGGAYELVDASCADWADPDPVFLADAVERLAARRAADPVGIARTARTKAEHYPWNQTVTAMLAVHAEVAGLGAEVAGLA